MLLMKSRTRVTVDSEDVLGARCVTLRQGEMMVITRDHNIYYLPCGDMCISTCLDQAEEMPSYEV